MSKSNDVYVRWQRDVYLRKHVNDSNGNERIYIHVGSPDARTINWESKRAKIMRYLHENVGVSFGRDSLAKQLDLSLITIPGILLAIESDYQNSNFFDFNCLKNFVCMKERLNVPENVEDILKEREEGYSIVSLDDFGLPN